MIYKQDDKIVRRKIDEGDTSKIPIEKYSGELQTIDNWIHFSKIGNNERYASEGLYKIDENGKQKKLISSEDQVEKLSVVGEWIIYTSSQNDEYPTLKRLSIKSDEIIQMN